MQLDHGRLVSENINNNLMARVLRKSDVQRAEVYFLFVLIAVICNTANAQIDVPTER